MAKVKETEIIDLQFKVPKEYYPEWYKKGCIPFEIDESRLSVEKERLMKEKESTFISGPRQKFSPTIIEDENDLPKIKQAEQMQPGSESEWFDEMSPDATEDRIIDNNDEIDVEKLQKHVIRVKESKKEMNTINDIRQKLISKKKAEDVAVIAAPGEFVVWFKNKVVNVGPLESTRKICEELILDNDDLDDDDLLIFLRIPINKIIK